MTDAQTVATASGASLEELESLSRARDWSRIVQFHDDERPDAASDVRSARRNLIFATALARQGKRADALQSALRSFALDPLNPYALCEVGDLLTGEDPDLAELFMRYALTLQRNPRVVSRVARFTSRAQRPKLYRAIRADLANGEGDIDAFATAAAIFDDAETLGRIADGLDNDKTVPPHTAFALASPAADLVTFWDNSYRRMRAWLQAGRATKGTSAFFADGAVRQFISKAVKACAGDRPVSSLKIVDMGCGDGFVLEGLVEAGARGAVGVDISPVALGLARERLGDRAELIQSDAVAWCGDGARDGGFDVIIDTFLAHCIEPEAADELMAHYKRMLAPSGVVVVAVSRTNPHRNRIYRKQIIPVRHKDTEARLIVAGLQSEWEDVRDASVALSRPLSAPAPIAG